MIKLLKDEKIILERRKHVFVIISEGMSMFLIASVPTLIVLGLLFFLPAAAEFIKEYASFFVFFLLILWQIILILFFIAWTNYYLDVLLLTDKRLIDIEQLGLFARDYAAVRLENIQDVKIEIIGFLATMLKMGDLHIQTAGQAKEIHIQKIANPKEVKELISKQTDTVLSKIRRPY